MNDKQLLGWAAHEIRGLRRANEIMAAKCEVLDIFRCAFYGPPQTQPMTQDFLRDLEDRSRPEAT